jgi:DNA repair protein SbcD/Mre11
MRATFVHTADNHLGYEQYGLKERFNDFAKAFLSVVDAAIERRADAFLIAGDLFNKRAIDAMTLMQAHEGLQRLKDAGIPAIAIEGNHDRTYYRDGTSWLQFLCWNKLLYLLNPLVREGVPALTPWDPEQLRGAYVDLQGGALRIYGLPWYGTSTARVMEGFAHELAAARAEGREAGVEYRLLLMHTGVDGIVPQLHGLPSYEQFSPLRGLVDYVALGHIHKQYVRDNWLYNPGSTETWGAEESAWDRGYFVGSIETEAAEGEAKHTVEHVGNPRRPFLRFTLRVDGLPTPNALYERFERHCGEWAAENRDVVEGGEAPVIDVGLTGILSFDGGAYEKARLEEIVTRFFEPLTVRIHDGTRDTEYDVGDDGEGGDGRDRATWQQLEVHVFQELLARDARFLPNAPSWAQVLANLKTAAINGDDPAVIAQSLRDARAKLLS